jgi:hypothetical protein
MRFEIVQVQAVVGYDVIKIADQLPLGENGELCEGRICFDEMTDRVAVLGRMIYSVLYSLAKTLLLVRLKRFA